MVYKITLSQPVPNIFNILESIGDFVIVSKNNYIVNTKKTKRNLVGKFGKVNIPNSDYTIIPLNEEEVFKYPYIVKTWYELYKLEQGIKSITEKEHKEALLKLKNFVDSLESELVKQSIKELKEGEDKLE